MHTISVETDTTRRPTQRCGNMMGVAFCIALWNTAKNQDCLVGSDHCTYELPNGLTEPCRKALPV